MKVKSTAIVLMVAGLLWRRIGTQSTAGKTISNAALPVAIGSFALFLLLAALLILNAVGMTSTVEPITEFLARFERDLAG